MKKMRFYVLVSFALLLVLSTVATAAQKASPAQPLIVLLTDFGESDHYVGAMKGSIYTADPAARIDYITHEIPKYDIVDGAFTLAEAAREFPDGTIFVAVVDPGVGSERKGIAILTQNRKLFVGPDNGLLSIAAAQAGIVEARQLTNRKLMRAGEISGTFHGRDIFGPVAAHLAAGAPFHTVGPVIPEIVKLPLPEAYRTDSLVVGVVMHVDDYGNLITNVPVSMIQDAGIGAGSKALITIGEKQYEAPFVRTYSDVPQGEPLFLSNKGFVEVALNMENLAEQSGARHGMEIRISPKGEGPPAH